MLRQITVATVIAITLMTHISIATTYDVRAETDVGYFYLWRYRLEFIYATANVYAENGADGWFSAHAEAGRRSNRDSGAYVAGRNGFTRIKTAVDNTDEGGYHNYRNAYINSQDDEDWHPR